MSDYKKPESATKMQENNTPALWEGSTLNSACLQLFTEESAFSNCNHFKNILEAMLDTTSALIVVLDLNGKICRFNKAAQLLTGYSENEVMEKNFKDFLVPEDIDSISKAFESMKDGKCSYQRENYWLTKNGSKKMIHWSNTSLTDPLGNVEYIVATGIDVTAYKRSEESLKSAEARYRLLVEKVPAVIYIAGASELNTYFYISPQIERLSGYTPYEWITDSQLWAKCIHHDDRKRIVEEIALLRSNLKNYSLEYRLVSKNKKVTWVNDESIVVYDHITNLHYFQGIITDISERKKFEKRITDIKSFDHLTKLPNRASFTNILNDHLDSSSKTNQSFAVLCGDLDQFKLINETFGHKLGDKLLIAVAKRMALNLRNADVIARTGGDEFSVILPGIQSHEYAYLIGRRLLDQLSNPFYIDGHELFVSASIGISIYPTDGSDAETLLKNVDAAMYYAKDCGRNKCQFFTSDLNEIIVERINVENGLRKAISNNEFELYYQPKVDITSGFIVGSEALIRWNHPQIGLVPPQQFIPAAEENGLILPITKWVLETACKQNALWQQAGHNPIEVAVNVSSRIFQQEDFVGIVKQVLKDTRLKAEYLSLEITESTMMEDPDLVVKILQELKEIGVQSSIDDFGTGYSSLAYIKKLPVSIIKVDRSFIKDICTNPDDAAIAQAVAAMAKSMNLRVIAEGVETIEQLKILQDLGYNEMQGYLVSPPVSADNFVRFFDDARKTHLQQI